MRSGITGVAALASLAVCLRVQGGQHPADASACSAFDRQGNSAMVTLAGRNLTLFLTRTSGEPVSLSLPFREPEVIGCGVFFNSDYSAFGCVAQEDSIRVELAAYVVVDVGAGKWTGDFNVRAQGSLGAPLTLVGFLRNSSSLVVLGGNPAVQSNPAAKTFSVAVLDTQGKQVKPPWSRTLPDNTTYVGNSDLADARNDRLWFKSSPNFCPLRSVPLGEDGPAGPIVEQAIAREACDVGPAVAYPDENTLIMAVHREAGDLVLRVDLVERGAERITLPAIRGYGNYTGVGRGFASPDGRVCAVVRELLSNTFFGHAHSGGDEIDIVQVRPLKLLGKIRLPRTVNPRSISINNQSGVRDCSGILGWSVEA